MNLQPTLEGQLVRLRPLSTEDFEPLFKAASDPLIWEQHPDRERYKREVFAKFLDGAIKSGGALVAIDNGSGEIIGSSRFYNLNSTSRELAIGYTFLIRRCWGGHFNSEMKKLMLDHAFTSVEQVYFEIGRDNTRSRKAIEKIGAKLHQETTRDNKPYCIYIIHRDE